MGVEGEEDKKQIGSHHLPALARGDALLHNVEPACFWQQRDGPGVANLQITIGQSVWGYSQKRKERRKKLREKLERFFFSRGCR